jgi:hypothetical protein
MGSVPDSDDIVYANDLDMTPEEVRRRYPEAVEYTALDGRPCWRESDLIDRDQDVAEGMS